MSHNSPRSQFENLHFTNFFKQGTNFIFSTFSIQIRLISHFCNEQTKLNSGGLLIVVFQELI